MRPPIKLSFDSTPVRRHAEVATPEGYESLVITDDFDSFHANWTSSQEVQSATAAFHDVLQAPEPHVRGHTQSLVRDYAPLLRRSETGDRLPNTIARAIANSPDAIHSVRLTYPGDIQASWHKYKLSSGWPEAQRVSHISLSSQRRLGHATLRQLFTRTASETLLEHQDEIIHHLVTHRILRG